MNGGAMNSVIPSASSDLFTRVASILEEARGNVVRSVNASMVLAYWLIGREIVQELQGGEERAAYGKQVVEELSSRLTERFEKGFFAQTLWNFRQFYQVYTDRFEILSPSGRELNFSEIFSPAGRESQLIETHHRPGSKLPQGFSPQLSWSHYRALIPPVRSAI